MKQKNFTNDELVKLTGYSEHQLTYYRRLGLFVPVTIGKTLTWDYSQLFLAKAAKELESLIPKQRVITLIRELLGNLSDQGETISTLWLNPFLVFSFLGDDGVACHRFDSTLAADYGLSDRVTEKGKNLYFFHHLVLLRIGGSVFQCDKAYILNTGKLKLELDESIKNLLVKV